MIPLPPSKPKWCVVLPEFSVIIPLPFVIHPKKLGKIVKEKSSRVAHLATYADNFTMYMQPTMNRNKKGVMLAVLRLIDYMFILSSH